MEGMNFRESKMINVAKKLFVWETVFQAKLRCSYE